MNKGRRNFTEQGIALVKTSAMLSVIGHEAFIASVKDALYQRSSVPRDKELKYLEQKIRYYWLDRYNVTIVPADLILHVAAYVQEVKALLYHSLLPSIRTRLCACLSQGMLLIGVNFYDAGQFQTARACFQIAVESAQEANNNILQASAWGWDSYSWMRSNATDRYELARDSLLKAGHFASLESDLALQCGNQAELAEVYAYLNEKDACVQALERANRFDRYEHGDWYHIHQLDLSSINGYRGFCLQQFYRSNAPDTYALLEEAKQALEVALSQPNVVALDRAFYVADMAQLHAHKGEVEAACDSVKKVISIADASTSLQQRLSKVRTLLEPYADVEVVKELDAQMMALHLAV